MKTNCEHCAYDYFCTEKNDFITFKHKIKKIGEKFDNFKLSCKCKKYKAAKKEVFRGNGNGCEDSV